MLTRSCVRHGATNDREATTVRSDSARTKNHNAKDPSKKLAGRIFAGPNTDKRMLTPPWESVGPRQVKLAG
jgi:hypothetical protein